MPWHNRKRLNYNRVHPLNYQRSVVQPTPQVPVQIYIDAAGPYVIGQIGGFYYRIPVNLGQPRPDSSNTSNPSQAPNKPIKLDPHEVLGIPVSATMEEITKAFRKKAKENHPDTVPQKTPESLAFAEERMKIINEAYNVLKK